MSGERFAYFFLRRRLTIPCCRHGRSLDLATLTHTHALTEIWQVEEEDRSVCRRAKAASKASGFGGTSRDTLLLAITSISSYTTATEDLLVYHYILSKYKAKVTEKYISSHNLCQGGLLTKLIYFLNR